MSAFRLTQITDTHLGERYAAFVANFATVSQYIDDTRPDLVINSGDVAFDGSDHPQDLTFARELHDALPVDCRFIPGNHDIGDNPTQVGKPPSQLPSERTRRQFTDAFGDDRWRFDAAGWSFIGLNSLIMNTGLACEAEQQEWLASELSTVRGRPLALFIHKPLFLQTPDDDEVAATSFRYVPMPARSRLVDLLNSIDLRLVACGHVHQRRDYTYRNVRQIWAPSASFIIKPDEKQERIGVKEVGLVDYVFRPDGFEVHHTRAPGQVDVDLYGLKELAALL